LIDLKDGFFHVPLRECDREKTTFYSGQRLYQFTKMPQGYKNSPAIFQRNMNLIFNKLIGKNCLIYVDDILVFGESIAEHDENLKLVLAVLEEYGLEENQSKRIESVENIKFLGYEISYNKIKPCVNRAQGILDFERPKTRKGLQRFLGMLNYDRMFIRNITEIIKPLYELLQKEKKFVWTDNHNLSFEKIKDEWKKMLELTIPDFDKEFTLETDASNVGIGAVLKQEGCPVAFISRSLNKSEVNYGITEKEVLAAL
jgi:hypothetical protein